MKTFDKKYKSILYYIWIFYILIPLISSIACTALTYFLDLTGLFSFDGMYLLPVLVLAVYFLFNKISKPTREDYKSGMYVNGVALLALTVIFTVLMFIEEGDINGGLIEFIGVPAFPFFPYSLLYIFGRMIYEIFVFSAMVFLSFLAGFIFCAVRSKALKPKRVLIPALCVVLCLCSCTHLYLNRPEKRYGGHGFDYMNGYSSTDFTDYTVYAKKSKLVTLDHEPSFVIENEEDMPVLDGAEACYPLYAAFAKAVYKDIDKIEEKYIGNEQYYEYGNGKIVTFTNTIYGFKRLVDKESYDGTVDMFFGARPSQSQLEYAKACGVEVEVTPIGKEAFVFFVEKDNPVDNIKSDELRKIYHGDIENWKELGGKNQKIVAFQRPEDSGSQTMMKYFMGDISLKEPKTYERVSAMEGVISEVAQYSNEDGALGYTFRYFLEGLNQEKGVKMLSVDGVYPTVESIEDGSYPITGDLCLITRKGDPNPNVKNMKDFILSDDGQYIIRKTGYGGLKNTQN